MVSEKTNKQTTKQLKQTNKQITNKHEQTDNEQTNKQADKQAPRTFFFGIKFRNRFGMFFFFVTFSILDEFLLLCWLHVCINCHTFGVPFSSIDFALILFRFFMILRARNL